jgi:hypothetical protein
MQQDGDGSTVTYRLFTLTERPRGRKLANLNEVPIPLRAQIITLARKGMRLEEIAARFELTLDRAPRFVDISPGSMEH